jgi:hypothetical protein
MTAVVVDLFFVVFFVFGGTRAGFGALTGFSPNVALLS